MSATFSASSDVKVTAAAIDPRTPAEREAGREAAAACREAWVRRGRLAAEEDRAGFSTPRRPA